MGLILDADVKVIKQLDETIAGLEVHVLRHAKVRGSARLYLLRTVPGVGKVLSLMMPYEIQNEPTPVFGPSGNAMGWRGSPCHSSGVGNRPPQGLRSGVSFEWAEATTAAANVRRDGTGEPGFPHGPTSIPEGPKICDDSETERAYLTMEAR